MVLSFLTFAILSNMKPADLSWMTGEWTSKVKGGTFEETWSSSAGGTMQGFGRQVSGGKTTFMEFLSIEDVEGKGTVMFIHIGALSKGAKPPVEFVLKSNTEKSALFEREADNDFPKTISYSRTGDKMLCVLTGREKGVDMKETFDFKKVRR